MQSIVRIMDLYANIVQRSMLPTICYYLNVYIERPGQEVAETEKNATDDHF